VADKRPPGEDFRSAFHDELNSRWTTEQLRELIESVNRERDRRYADRFEAIEKTMGNGFTAAKEAVAAALAAAKEAVQSAFVAAKEAITKQETATEKRFEGVNEFRSQLKDQQQTFIPRAEAEQRNQQLRDMIDAMNERLQVLERGASRESGMQDSGVIARQNASRIAALLITSTINLLGLIAAVVFFLIGKH
jgi:hypothetical protein